MIQQHAKKYRPSIVVASEFTFHVRIVNSFIVFPLSLKWLVTSKVMWIPFSFKTWVLFPCHFRDKTAIRWWTYCILEDRTFVFPSYQVVQTPLNSFLSKIIKFSVLLLIIFTQKFIYKRWPSQEQCRPVFWVGLSRMMKL